MAPLLHSICELSLKFTSEQHLANNKVESKDKTRNVIELLRSAASAEVMVPLADPLPSDNGNLMYTEYNRAPPSFGSNLEAVKKPRCLWFSGTG
jgi:hypothetical protein